MRAGEHHDQFVVDPIQGGAGTSTNMNANEVIANLALEQLGHDRGQYDIVHPLEHVNLGQSTNDVYPTAIKTALHGAVGEVLSTLRTLRQAFEDKAAELVTTVKLGRTQLQDAVPMTLGQEFNAFAGTLAKDETELVGARRQLCELNLGGTAIGTALNSHPDFRTHALAELRSITGIQELHSAADLVESTQDTGAFVHLSGTLKRTAVKLSKICNDLRLLSSGPRAGLHEIALPAVQAGSSMMPGKINPVIPEVVNQVAFEVIGNDLTVTLAAEAGQLQLNAFEPIIARSLLASTAHLTAAMRVLDGTVRRRHHRQRRTPRPPRTRIHGHGDPPEPGARLQTRRRTRRRGARCRWRRPRTSPEQRPARRSPGPADRGRRHHPGIGGPARSGASRGRSAMSTEQRVAVVTGGNRGIGLEICRQLADRGYQVVLAARDAGRAAKLAAELDASRPGAVTSVRLDVAEAGSVQTAFREIRERHHRIDVLVNNAGIAVDGPDHRPSAPDLAVVLRTLETNLLGAWRCCAEVVPSMHERGYGRIVNLSSTMASLELTRTSTSPAYRISKTGLNMLTRTLAAELDGTGILVNAASPGYTLTDMSPDAQRPVRAGADTPVWLATLPDTGPTGGFFFDRETLAW